MKLLLVRHGQTDWNHAQRFQGQSDVPLNHTGIQQAGQVAKRLATEKIDFIYSSDLARAVDTATAIAKNKLTLTTDIRLRELHFGDWEGLTYNAIKEKYPQHLAIWENDVYQIAPPNGETVAQLTERVQSFLNDLFEKNKEKTVLIVAHGGVLQTLICLALKLSPSMYWQFHISPASLSEIAFYPAGAILNYLNNTSHLSPRQTTLEDKQGKNVTAKNAKHAKKKISLSDHSELGGSENRTKVQASLLNPGKESG